MSEKQPSKERISSSKEEEEEREEIDEENENNNTLTQSKKQRKDEPDEEEEEEETSNQDFDAQRQAFLQHLLSSVFMSRRGGVTNNDELIASLKESGVINNARVEEAIRKVPRGYFVPKEEEDDAYIDAPLRLSKFGFNISAPHMYALCLENLNILPGMSVLDIGSGCGHLTAIASYLVGPKGTVHGLELRDDIIKFSQQNLRKASDRTGIDFSNIKFFLRNCFLPTVQQQQYDRIHVGACCPESRLDQLVSLLLPGGILVTPFGDKLVKVMKDLDGKMKMEKLMSVRYGDLIIPSEAEIKEAERQLEREKETTIAIPPSTFPHDFIKLFNNPDLSDVTFQVEGKSVYGHKIILAARSEHFRAMFFSGLRESRENVVTIPDMQYQSFLDCLQFIYTGDTAIRNPDHAIELISAANYFKLERLKAICEDIIKQRIEIENAAYILQIASSHDALQLKRVALNFILENYEAVEQTKCFDELDKPMLLEVTKAASKFFRKT